MIIAILRSSMMDEMMEIPQLRARRRWSRGSERLNMKRSD
jgi:hypothetical protein